jgi:hypothetical protein
MLVLSLQVSCLVAYEPIVRVIRFVSFNAIRNGVVVLVLIKAVFDKTLQQAFVPPSTRVRGMPFLVFDDDAS